MSVVPHPLVLGASSPDGTTAVVVTMLLLTSAGNGLGLRARFRTLKGGRAASELVNASWADAANVGARTT